MQSFRVEQLRSPSIASETQAQSTPLCLRSGSEDCIKDPENMPDMKLAYSALCYTGDTCLIYLA